MRDEGGSGRHWMERKTLGDRASFHIERTGEETGEGAKVLRAFLRIKDVREIRTKIINK